jgi:hypothetical protein
MHLLDPTEPQWFIPTFALMWVAITGLLAQVGGWATLAKQFRSDDAASGDRFWFVSGSMGLRYLPVSYGSCLFLNVSNTGFRLSILFAFRLFSPPLFVPWAAVESVERKRFLLLVPYVLIRIRDQWPTVAIRGRAGRRLEEGYAQALAGAAS